MAEVILTRPSIFKYLDYRNFLRDYTEYLRSRGEYSIRKFAAQVGFKANSFMNMVIAGRRNLSRDSIRLIAEGLKLQNTETEFFERLVHFAQAKTLEEKDKTYQELLSFQKFQKVQRGVAAQYEYFNNWYIVALYEALGTDFARLSAENMARELDISEPQLRDALDILSQLGLIAKEGKIWKKKDAAFHTPIATQSLNIRNFHRQMIQKALESLDTIPPEQRALRSMTISLSGSSFEEVKKKTFQFVEHMNTMYSEERNPEKVYQMNIQVFPLFRVNPNEDL